MEKAEMVRRWQISAARAGFCAAATGICGGGMFLSLDDGGNQR
jgi:hypothetical protein